MAIFFFLLFLLQCLVKITVEPPTIYNTIIKFDFFCVFFINISRRILLFLYYYLQNQLVIPSGLSIYKYKIWAFPLNLTYKHQWQSGLSENIVCKLISDYTLLNIKPLFFKKLNELNLSLELEYILVHKPDQKLVFILVKELKTKTTPIDRQEY